MRIFCCFLAQVVAFNLWAADPPQPVIVSAASPQVGVAPDSLATIYGPNLATQTATAGNPPWPTSLGDMSGVTLIDSAGRSWPIPLIFVSPNQMNVYIPAGAATGPANIKFPFTTGIPPGAAAALRVIPATLTTVAPAIFTADGNGGGVLAADTVTVSPVGQFWAPVFTCTTSGSCTPVPFGLGVDTPIYLVLYGTGIRGWTTAGTPDFYCSGTQGGTCGGPPINPTVQIGSQSFPASYAGTQQTIPGLDQVNVLVPLTLRGAGLVNVSVTAAGVTSNLGQIYIN
jgi:uncharacterized protein (TIGR03437 family)